MFSRTFYPACARAAFAAVFILGALFAVVEASAQEGPVYNRTRAIAAEHSEAELRAEEATSLSAEKLISLLQDEPGLLLEVKKDVFRKAFEQGRIIESRELSDEALFRQLREDESIRVLATREVTQRFYVRVLPTREERKREASANAAVGRPKENGSKASRTMNQEERYWSDQENPFMPPTVSPLPYLPSYPSTGSENSPLRQPPEVDDRRMLEQAGNDAEEGNDIGSGFANPGATEPNLSRDLPGLIRTGSERQILGGADGGEGTGNVGRNKVSSDELSSTVAGSARQSSPSAGYGMNTSGRDPLHDREAARDRAALAGYRDLARRLPMPPEYSTLRHRVNPYADVPSLYDLYAQYGSRSPTPVRFADGVFHNGTGNSDMLPMDIPVGLDYVVGPGDGVNINLSGGVAERLRRVVDPEGRIALPESGPLQVSGRSLGEVQQLVQVALQRQFHDVRAEVSLARLRTVRVYVVGDVERAGAYDVSSLSTPLNAVFMAGGPTTRGSTRTVRHYRGKTLLQEVDVYDLLLHGVRSGIAPLQSGDTVLVPPLGPEITIEGMVRRPAIYEIRDEHNLAEALALAGGVLSSGTLRHVDVERVQAHESRTMLRLDIPENNDQEETAKALENFTVQDGDKVKISPILPYADKTVYLEGHVFRPGKYAFREGMLITDLIKSYQDLLPEPSVIHAEIVRLRAPDNTPQVLAFNLDDALKQKGELLSLQPFDTVRIFSRFDFEDPPVITVAGEVRDPGDHLTNGSTRVRDAIYLAGGLTPDASVASAQIFRRSGDRKLVVLSVNLQQALAGSDLDNLPLQPKDRIVIHRNLAKVDPANVTIEGEVGRPGRYPLGENMTAAGLVRTAGGFTRAAFVESADLTRYNLEAGQKVGEHETVAIERALAGEPDTDLRLRDGDVLTIRELAGWHDVGASITVGGEVMHPGVYGIEQGERLSSILERAGGLRQDAYPYGAIFERVQVRISAERNRAELLRNIENEGPALQSAPETDANEKAAKGAALLQWQSTMQRLQGTPPAGRLVIHISSDFKRWKGTSADIALRAGDSIYLPKGPTSVMVDGAVYNPTAVAYHPGKSAGWYLGQSGGPSNSAFKKGIFVVRADGSVAGGAGGMFRGGMETAEMRPGDTIVVPEKAFSANTRWKSILEGSQIAYAVGIAIQVAKTF